MTKVKRGDKVTYLKWLPEKNRWTTGSAICIGVEGNYIWLVQNSDPSNTFRAEYAVPMLAQHTHTSTLVTFATNANVELALLESIIARAPIKSGS